MMMNHSIQRNTRQTLEHAACGVGASRGVSVVPAPRTSAEGDQGDVGTPPVARLWKHEPCQPRIVAVASDPGDLVLDPFSGSATTGVAAIAAGRRYIGIERKPNYCEVSRRRLSQHDWR